MKVYVVHVSVRDRGEFTSRVEIKIITGHNRMLVGVATLTGSCVSVLQVWVRKRVWSEW